MACHQPDCFHSIQSLGADDLEEWFSSPFRRSSSRFPPGSYNVWTPKDISNVQACRPGSLKSLLVLPQHITYRGMGKVRLMSKMITQILDCSVNNCVISL